MSVTRALLVWARAGVLTLCVARSSSGQGALGSSRPGIDITHYAFDLELPARGGWIDGNATIALRRSARVDTLEIDLVGLQVESAAINGRPTSFAQTDSALRLTLPPWVGVPDSLLVSVWYAGAPRDGLIFSTDSTAGAARWQAFGDNFPNRARFWLPVVDHPSDKATVAWTVRAPADRRVVANGELLEETPLAGGRTLTRWQTRRPISTYLMVIGVAPFTYVDLGESACGLGELRGCVRQSLWASPGVRDYLPGPFARAPAMLEYFARLVGPYPYTKLAHVQSATRYGGMENASAIFYSDAAFRRRNVGEGLIAHETAHQWFGNAVTEREWPEVWLSEGFATYFAQLWTEHAHGDSAFRAGMLRMRDAVLRSDITLQKAVIDTTLRDLAQVLNSNVYQKAGFALHMLRGEIGDSAFFRAIRAYVAKYRHANASTSDLTREFERTAGRSLGWFFDQWFRRPGVADLTVGWRYDARRRRVSLSVEQNAGAPYRVRLAVDIVAESATAQAGRRSGRGNAASKRRAVVTVPAQRSAQIEIPLALDRAPVQVIVDADGAVLGTVRLR
ncbi:MAG: M1 family metallopeptidase [Gemmatimonadaceae bacterium]